MENSQEKSPILNNPYEEPRFHYDTDSTGNLDYEKIISGRRPYTSSIGINPEHHEPSIFSGSDFENDDPNAPFINSIREAVGQWRDGGYDGATRITRELLQFWFCNSERANFQRLFFCQREAVETAVWFNEIAPRNPNQGQNLLRQLDERRQTISSNHDDILPRMAFKMATGTGKTVVMAMLVLYHYLNKKSYPQDTRFADHFLFVTPGITIRDRLTVLYLDETEGYNEWDKQDYYHKRGLIPKEYRQLLGGLNAAITIVNYQQFLPKDYTGNKQGAMDGKLKFTESGEMQKVIAKESHAHIFRRIFGSKPKGRLLVINDEAHHCYLPKVKSKKDNTNPADENYAARVWYEGLRQLRLCGYNLQQVYDLSATPYYISGSGYKEYSLFPWVVSDFGLVEAIESGLVKIPYLPESDDSKNLTEPVLRNIYEAVKYDLPRMGQKTKKKKDKQEGKSKQGFEPAPELPALMKNALEQFVKDYEDYNQGMRNSDEQATDLFTAPPVFIVVCNNTSVSKEVYKYIAGYQKGTDENGNPVYVDGKFPEFSNYKDGLPLSKAPTLLIDSSVINEAETKIDKDFKAVFKDEIENFKREYSNLHGAAAAGSLSEADILREVVNTVGKPGSLGGHIKCVVSVSMLTEGWDANTVTHVMGVRAFGSQLLCEQVAGRALRRRSYDLLPYNAGGDLINLADLKKYKPENVVWKFPPEYAHIIGVPFKTFKQKGGGATPPRPPQHTIEALDERKQYEIKFPVVEGYMISVVDDQIIEADFSHCVKYRLDLTNNPVRTILGTAFGEGNVEMQSDYKQIRDASVVYELTRRLISQKFSDNENGRQFYKFAKLKNIVQTWYDTQIDVSGGNGDPDLRRLVLNENEQAVIESIYEGIKAVVVAAGGEDMSAILNHYNPEGSTAFVHGVTVKPVFETAKSHINFVVADTKNWEQTAAKYLEECEDVECYVKNHFLAFRIPYMIAAKPHYYLPDFIARVKTKNGGKVNLIIEISGWSNDNTGHKDVKRHYTENYWLPAVNKLGTFGKWDFLEITDIDHMPQLLNEKIKAL